MDHKKDVSQHSGSPLHKAEIEWVLYYGKTRIIAVLRKVLISRCIRTWDTFLDVHSVSIIFDKSMTLDRAFQ